MARQLRRAKTIYLTHSPAIEHHYSATYPGHDLGPYCSKLFDPKIGTDHRR